MILVGEHKPLINYETLVTDAALSLGKVDTDAEQR